MSGSTFGKIFRITTWGESHGPALGVTIDGCPAGLKITQSDIQKELNLRKPGVSPYSTPRKEDDEVKILSGIFNDTTTGTPISLMVFNNNQRSRDYDQIKNTYRPGHADYGFDEKYGLRDYRGGGRSSGRETIGRVAAAAIAKAFLSQLGIKLKAYTISIGPHTVPRKDIDLAEVDQNNLKLPHKETYDNARQYLDQLKEEGNSAGGTVECVVTGMPTGVGEPVFSKLDAELSKGIMSIGAVKGIEFGSGFKASAMTGIEHNDAFYVDEHDKIHKKTNHAGGILGGISDGSDIILRAAFKPTSSISLKQNTITTDHKNAEIIVEGRHDPIIAPRAVIVVEAMTAITLTDLILQNTVSNMEKIQAVYLKNK